MIIKELFARLGLDVDKGGFTAGEAAIGGVKTGIVALGGIAVAATAALVGMVHGLVQTTSTINDTAQAVGISTDALQELGYGAKINGSSMEEFSQSLIILSRRLLDAKEGSEEAAKTFAKLHIKITDGKGGLKDTETLVGDISEALSKLPDGAKKTALAVDLFGRSGARLIPMLNGGRAGLEQFKQEVRDLGFLIDKDTIKAGDDLGDNIDRLKAIFLGLQGAIAGPLLNQLNDLVDQFRAWFKANKALIGQRMDQITKLLAASIRGLVIVLKVLWAVLGTVIDYWQILAVLLASGVLTAITLNAAAIVALGLGYLRAGAAAALAGARAAVAWVAAAAGPIAIAAAFALIILLIDEIVTGLDGGLTILGIIGPKWSKFIDDFAHGGDENDAWWLKGLRAFVYMVTHLREYWQIAVDGMKGLLNDFLAWLSNWAASVGKAIASPVTGLAKFLDNKVFSHISFGGGSSPAASAATSSAVAGSVSVDQKNTYQIQVSQQPGQSSTDLVGELDRTLTARQSTQLEETLQAVGG